LAVSHALLDSANAHGILAAAPPDQCVNAEYLASLQAPFDWQEAQTRVTNALQP
jgi:hypothetical protein